MPFRNEVLFYQLLEEAKGSQPNPSPGTSYLAKNTPLSGGSPHPVTDLCGCTQVRSLASIWDISEGPAKFLSSLGIS